jgi:hypothetical protein
MAREQRRLAANLNADRVARRGRLGVGPWLAVAAGLVILLGAAWLAFSPGPAPNRVELRELKAGDLEHLLAETRHLEQEAQARPDAAAAARSRADAELARARGERRKAEDELMRLKAEIDARGELAAVADERQAADAAAAQDAEDEQARRRLEAALPALRRVEAEAFARAAAETANQRRADEALAEAQAGRRLVEAESRRVEAELAEARLQLGPADRQRLQVALMALGFDVVDADGVFGPRSREMIARWQQTAGAPATGFVTEAERDALVQSATAAIAHWEEGRKKAEERRRLAEERKAQAATIAAAAPEPAAEQDWPAAPPPPASVYDGAYAGSLTTRSGGRLSTFKVEIRDGRGSGVQSRLDCGQAPLVLTISDAGEVSGTAQLFGPTCIKMQRPIRGRALGRALLLTIDGQFVELVKPN